MEIKQVVFSCSESDGELIPELTVYMVPKKSILNAIAKQFGKEVREEGICQFVQIDIVPDMLNLRLKFQVK